MSFWSEGFLNAWLSRKTGVFGLRLWVVVGVGFGAAVVVVLFFLSLCLVARFRRRRRRHSLSLPLSASGSGFKSNKPLKIHLRESALPSVAKDVAEIPPSVPPPTKAAELRVELEKPDHHFAAHEASGRRDESMGRRSPATPEVSQFGWGHWYTLREIEEATGGLAEENVIGEGGYGIVYRGVLADGTVVAVKNLLNNRGQAEKEFKVEVEAIGRVRHKNLVRLLGYCAEGANRMLVYEYIENGNLDQWLHGDDAADMSPLTWDVRMNIILGTAKGLAYLHEGLEPKVVHRDVKSSNILLDRHWNPKVSDFGLAKLLCSERSYVTTRVMGTFGYVAPEYASTGMLNERSDVYSFGVLIMEIITGRTPVDYTRPPGEVNLVEWLKDMVADRKAELVLDPKLLGKPPSKVLKRALLVALRCVDAEGHKRPKMGHVIHMLETDDLLLLREDRSSSTKGEHNSDAGSSFSKRTHQYRGR